MTTTKLITRTEIQARKQLSNSVYDDKLNEIIIEAQFNDLRPLLGEDLYNAILKDVEASGTTYDALLDGGEYTYQNKTYQNYGLKAVLTYYVTARYSLVGDVIDNPFGKTIKLNVNESQPISHQQKKTIYNMDRQTAYNYWLNVERYLTRTNETLYKNCTKSNTNFKISRIG